MWRWGLNWLLLGALYLLLAGQASFEEGGTAVLCAAVAATSAMLVRVQATHRLKFRLEWLRAAHRPALALLRDTFRVGRFLLGALLGGPRGGRILFQPFRHGGHTPVAAARRGLVILGTSLPPNSFVLDQPPDSLLLHRLAPDPHPPADREWPL